MPRYLKNIYLHFSSERKLVFIKNICRETFLLPLSPCFSFPRSVRGFCAWKAFGKVIIVVAAARWRVYAHHGNIESKGNPRRQAPLSNFGLGGGRELHIVIDFNAFHCWCHVPSFISSMYSTGMPRLILRPVLMLVTPPQRTLSVCACVCVCEAG